MKYLPENWANSTQRMLIFALLLLIVLFGISFSPISKEIMHPQRFLWYVYGPILITIYALSITAFVFCWVVIFKQKIVIKGLSYLLVATGLCLFCMVVLPSVYP